MNKIGIITALSAELKPILDVMDSRSLNKTSFQSQYEGTLENVHTIAICSGMGKVNAALATQMLIDKFAPDAVINAGSAGALDTSLLPGDLVVADSIVYHDIDDYFITAFEPFSAEFFPDVELLSLCRERLPHARFGRFASGDIFVSGELGKAIFASLSPLCVDMETAAVAHACYVNSVPFLAVRCISDSADDEAWEHFERNIEQASSVARDAVLNILRPI